MTDKLWTRDFLSASIGNFLLFFAFYLLLPIFPLYLIDTFEASKSVVGLVLSAYTLAALLIRPISGFMLDMFPRKPQYLLAFLLFVLTFISYPLLTSINLFLLFRVLHGFSFGYVTTASNSLVVDILPSSKRGEGLGYFGVANNLAMVVGPMTSLLMYEKGVDYNTIFFISILSGLLGFIFAMSIRLKKPFVPTPEQALGLDRFFLFKGFKAGVTFLLTGIPYGMLMTYLAIYAQELGITVGSGAFFTLFAVGLIASRMMSGKMVDRGRLTNAIQIGMLVSGIGMLVLASLQRISGFSHEAVLIVFFILPVALGLGYGLLFSCL